MRRLDRRTLLKGAGAGLVLAPFHQLLTGRGGHAAGPGRCKRLFLFCTMGTHPDLWSPTAVTDESTFTFSDSTSPLAAIKGDVVLIEGLPSGNPGDGHGAPDGLTGLGYGVSDPRALISVDQFVADKLIAGGVTRPIPSLLLGANTTAGGGRTMFYRANNLPTIGSPTSAYGTVFGAAMPVSGPPPEQLLRRRKSILDNLRGEIGELSQQVGAPERARLDLHLESVRQIETRLSQAVSGAGAACATPPAPAADPVGDLPADLAPVDVAVGALACAITRVVACSSVRPGLPVDPPASGSRATSTVVSSTAARDFKNPAFEKWLASAADVVDGAPSPRPMARARSTTRRRLVPRHGRRRQPQPEVDALRAGAARAATPSAPTGRYLARRRRRSPRAGLLQPCGPRASSTSKVSATRRPRRHEDALAGVGPDALRAEQLAGGLTPTVKGRRPCRDRRAFAPVCWVRPAFEGALMMRVVSPTLWAPLTIAVWQPFIIQNHTAVP
jgi:hypothetical protein